MKLSNPVVIITAAIVVLILLLSFAPKLRAPILNYFLGGGGSKAQNSNPGVDSAIEKKSAPPGFRGPSGPPHIRGPAGPPPNY